MRQWIDPVAMALAAVAMLATVGCPAGHSSRRSSQDAPPPSRPSAGPPPAAARAVAAPLVSALALGQAQPAAPATQRHPAGKQPAEKQAARPAPRRRPAPPLEPVPEEPNVIPPVLLTEQLQAASWFHVGEEFPDLRLPSLTGKTSSLSDLTGGKLSLVVIWTPDHPYCREELADLPRLAAPAGEALRVVTICWGHTAEAARDVAESLDFKYPVLVDAARQALAPKSPLMLPQTYLLDPQRKVLWCDLEYARATRRQLVRALRVAAEGR